MLYISNITNDPSQRMTLTGIPGATIIMTLRFLPRVRQWLLGVDDGTNSIQGISLMCSPNILHAWKNILPYGICCLRGDGLDPYQIGDFQNMIANLYLLDAADVAQVESDWFQ